MSTLDLTALTTRLGHLGCHEPAASPNAAIEVWENSAGQTVLSSRDDRFTGDLDWIEQRLADLDAGCGTDAVWDALRDEDDYEDDGQPDSLQEHQDFAHDDDLREYMYESYDPFCDE
jgi:hypothetical protein